MNSKPAFLLLLIAVCATCSTQSLPASQEPTAYLTTTTSTTEAPPTTPDTAVPLNTTDPTPPTTARTTARRPRSTLPPTTTRPPLSDPPDAGLAPEQHAIDPDQLAKAVSSTVALHGRACGRSREGTGFAIHDGNYIATNGHVLYGIDDITVVTNDKQEFKGTIVAFDAVNDLAIVRIAGASLAPFSLGGTSPDGTLGAVMGWSGNVHDGFVPAPTPFRIDRPVVVRTFLEGGDERVERRAWLLAAEIEQGHSGAALLVLNTQAVDGGVGGAAKGVEETNTPAGESSPGHVIGVVWGQTRRPDSHTVYATRGDELVELLAGADLTTPVEVPDCR